LRHYGVTHILNVTIEVADKFPGLYVYRRVAISDKPSAQIIPHFDDSFRFIDEARAAGGCVLVHCYYGNSRSASFVIGYLMTSERMRYADSLRYLQILRPEICPNNGFQRQLKEYESTLARLSR
jgi:protein-tyrosine phosphatase